MGYRDLFSFLLTAFLYVGVGYLFFYASQTVEVSDKLSPVKTIELSLQAYQPPQPIAEEIPEPVVEETPPLEQQTPPPKPKTLKTIPLEPVVKKPEPPKPEPKKEKPKKVEKKPKKKKVRKSTPSQAKQSIKVQKSSARQKDIFLSKIRAKINKNKAYPRMAKRRGMQGSVKVSFTIQPNGQVAGIKVTGPKAFHKSAKKAVKKAFPVSVKNVPLRLPKSVAVTLHYKLRK